MLMRLSITGFNTHKNKSSKYRQISIHSTLISWLIFCMSVTLLVFATDCLWFLGILTYHLVSQLYLVFCSFSGLMISWLNVFQNWLKKVALGVKVIIYCKNLKFEIFKIFMVFGKDYFHQKWGWTVQNSNHPQFLSTYYTGC